ncbi:MAG: helix-turn-helix transcriptional regulator [Rhodoferax sp.]|nr:helix-turn-helix transcriptional regulator [Rhodoferax sp.]MDP3651663.1 helix-turn-helix transcriptional regulator [Rhodoferax sp.]
MLNIKFIKSTMRLLGLTGQDLAGQCDVSKEAVSNWLSGESIPRPSKLALLATNLKVSIDQLLLVDNLGPAEPVIAYRMRNNRALTEPAKEAGDEVGRHLRQLLPFTGVDSIFTPRHLELPTLDADYIAKAAKATRVSLGLSPIEAVTHKHLISLFHSFGALLVPVFWGGNKDGHENAMSVYLPDSKASLVLFNMGCRLDDFSYWLAHEFGHCLTLHALRGQEGETFAEQFAQQLLFPDIVAKHALAEIRVSPSPLSIASRFAGSYGVSVVAVVKAADRVAEAAGEKKTDLATGSFFGQWKRSSKTALTAAQELFGTSTPSPVEFIVKSEQLFRTPIFRAMARWQRDEGGRNPAFISAAFNLNMGDAVAMSYALWDLTD